MAVCDQCLVSGVNFIIAIMLARCMYPSEYGLFIFATTCLVLTSGLFSSIIGISMNILGPNSSQKEWEVLFLNCFGVLLTLMLGLIMMFFCLYWIMRTGAYAANAQAFTTLALVVPLTLGHDFFRNAQLSRLNIKGALLTDIATHGSRILIIYLLTISPQLSNQKVLWIYGISAALGITVGYSSIRPQFSKLTQAISSTILSKIWASSKWTFADWIPFVLYGYLYIFIVTFVLGNEKTGVLGACRNIIAPIVMLQVGISSFLLPYFCRLLASKGHEAMLTSLIKILISLAFVILLYLTIVNLFAGEIMRVFFSHYASYTYLVLLFSVGIFINYSFKIAEIYLLATVRPKFIFMARILAAIPAVILCYPLVKTYGINGGGYSYIVSNLLMCASMLAFMLYSLREYEPEYTYNPIGNFEK